MLAFLYVPPLIAPPGANSSPSRVTILTPLPDRLAMATAWSNVSTIRVLPRSDSATCRQPSAVLTRVSAVPITPAWLRSF